MEPRKLGITTKEFFERLKNGDFSSPSGDMAAFKRTLLDSGMQAYYFETPPMNKNSANLDNFEFVLLETSSDLASRPDPGPFYSHFEKLHPSENVAVFQSLGKDSTLVAPRPPLDRSDQKYYGHLAAFMQNPDKKRINEFWQKVGATGLDLMKKDPGKPIWMSTSGRGVSWLHLRFDTRPKYYQYEAYKVPPGKNQIQKYRKNGNFCLLSFFDNSVCRQRGLVRWEELEFQKLVQK